MENSFSRKIDEKNYKFELQDALFLCLKFHPLEKLEDEFRVKGGEN